MGTILVISITIIVALVALSQYFNFSAECDDNKVLFDYKVLSFAVAGCAVVYTVMTLTYGTLWCFILYAVDKFLKAIIMVEIVILTQNMIDVDKKYISAFISYITYGTVFVFLLDTLLKSGELTSSFFGVYFSPRHPLHLVAYFFYYMVYVIILITFVVYKSATVVRRSEKRDLILLFEVYLFSVMGFVAEVFMINYKTPYFPMALIFNLLAVMYMRKVINYHNSIIIKLSDFKKELDPSRTDIAFVMDDRMKILYQNSRAEVFAKIYEDEYIGRKLNEIFEMSAGTCDQIMVNPDDTPFGISGKYLKNERTVNMVVQHRLDPFGEVIATGVFVYNLEDCDVTEDGVVVPENDDETQMIERAKSITNGARVLIVDEEVVFLNVFTRVLQQFDVKVTRCIGGRDALDMLKSHVYDIIFVTYEMKDIDGGEMIRRLRAMPGQYYQQVPVVIMTKSDINDVFTNFIEAGFNDFLKKPVVKKNLLEVLTRWLWQRFDAEVTTKAQATDTRRPQIDELLRQLECAILMHEQEKYNLFKYCINAIKHLLITLGYMNIADVATELERAVEFGETDKVLYYFNRFEKDVRVAITIDV